MYMPLLVMHIPTSPVVVSPCWLSISASMMGLFTSASMSPIQLRSFSRDDQVGPPISVNTCIKHYQVRGIQLFFTSLLPELPIATAFLVVPICSRTGDQITFSAHSSL